MQIQRLHRKTAHSWAFNPLLQHFLFPRLYLKCEMVFPGDNAWESYQWRLYISQIVLKEALCSHSLLWAPSRHSELFFYFQQYAIQYLNTKSSLPFGTIAIYYLLFISSGCIGVWQQASPFQIIGFSLYLYMFDVSFCVASRWIVCMHWYAKNQVNATGGGNA